MEFATEIKYMSSSKIEPLPNSSISAKLYKCIFRSWSLMIPSLNSGYQESFFQVSIFLKCILLENEFVTLLEFDTTTFHWKLSKLWKISG